MSAGAAYDTTLDGERPRQNDAAIKSTARRPAL